MRQPARHLAAFGPLVPAAALIIILGLIPVIRIFQETLASGSSPWTTIFTSTVFRLTLINTFTIAAIVTIGCVLVAYPVAYWIDQQPRRVANRYLLLILIPFAISILVRSYAWMAILGKNGPVNRLAVSSGISEQPLDLLFTRFAVVIGMMHYLLPFMLLALYAVLGGIDKGLVDAAKTMGASSAFAFRKIYLPLSLAGVVAGAVYVFVLALGFYIVPSLLGGPKDMTVAVFIERQASRLSMDVAGAASAILLVVSLALFVILDRFARLETTLAVDRPAAGRG